MEPSIFGLIFRKQTFSKMNQGQKVVSYSKELNENLTAPSLMVFQSTGQSLSDTLIFASTNPQYDNRLVMDLPVQYMKTKSSGENMLCTQIISCFCFDLQNKFSCTELVNQ